MLSVLHLTTILIIIGASSTYVMYLNYATGLDTEHCGNLTNPCKTLMFSWNSLRARLPIYDIEGDILFKITPGYYDKQVDVQPLQFNCLRTNISSFTVMADVSRQVVKQGVEICQSFHLSNCNVSFYGIHFTSLRQGVTLTDSSSVRIKNCKFKMNSLYPLLNIDTAWSVRLEHVEIIYNTLQLSKRKLELKEIKTFDMSNLLIKENKNLHIVLKYNSVIRSDNVSIKNNENFTLHIADSAYTASHLALERNHGNIASHNYVEFRSNATILLKYAKVRCNKYIDSRYASVFQAQSGSTLKCEDCAAQECKVLCGPGEEITDGVLCTECSLGFSAHYWEQNCRKCRYGYYSAKVGATDCVACSKGTFCSKFGCTSCRKCTNDFFTSTKGSSSCSQMSTLFIVLLGVVILLTFSPIIIITVRKSRRTNVDEDNEEESVKMHKNDDNTNDEQPLIKN